MEASTAVAFGVSLGLNIVLAIIILFSLMDIDTNLKLIPTREEQVITPNVYVQCPHNHEKITRIPFKTFR